MDDCKKVKFANEEAALYYVKKLKDTSRRLVVPQKAYLCPKCMCWHLTSQKRNNDAEIIELRAKVKELGLTIFKLNAEIRKLKEKKAK